MCEFIVLFVLVNFLGRFNNAGHRLAYDSCVEKDNGRRRRRRRHATTTKTTITLKWETIHTVRTTIIMTSIRTNKRKIKHTFQSHHHRMPVTIDVSFSHIDFKCVRMRCSHSSQDLLVHSYIHTSDSSRITLSLYLALSIPLSPSVQLTQVQIG